MKSKFISLQIIIKKGGFMNTKINRSLFFKVSVSAIARLILYTGIRINDFYKDLKIELVFIASSVSSSNSFHIGSLAS